MHVCYRQYITAIKLADVSVFAIDAFHFVEHIFKPRINNSAYSVNWPNQPNSFHKVQNRNKTTSKTKISISNQYHRAMRLSIACL